ncbi:hypothetical protein SAMN05192566_0296 [Methylophilus rhizosphaerae]|uniref:Uncharacterized protein n=1 Tax=Methylophilus rhizosphaerae TaxID=492660 RepID=A0A1G8ZGF6_9PROT|nr:hypothetical protein [Methylophilus rhizosphaerae]SDK14141.1 hypothetical protein SAMN05192566_0296 [Methylophilus rhizosphaerae]
MKKQLHDIDNVPEQTVELTKRLKSIDRIAPQLTIEHSSSQRIGVIKGKLAIPDTIDAHNEEVLRLFTGAPA